jgi:toxin-antitoxin system PIN domain toxin
VKRALLDANVLLALAWPNHQHHAAAHRWFGREAAHGWATCALTALAFVRLSSNPAYTAAAVTPSEAATLLRDFTGHRHHRFWAAAPPPLPALFARAAGHQQVVDAYLVGLAQHHRGRLATFDAPLAAHAGDAGLVHVIPAALD